MTLSNKFWRTLFGAGIALALSLVLVLPTGFDSASAASKLTAAPSCSLENMSFELARSSGSTPVNAKSYKQFLKLTPTGNAANCAGKNLKFRVGLELANAPIKWSRTITLAKALKADSQLALRLSYPVDESKKCEKIAKKITLVIQDSTTSTTVKSVTLKAPGGVPLCKKGGQISWTGKPAKIISSN